MKSTEIRSKESKESEAFILKVWFELLTYTPKYVTWGKEYRELDQFILPLCSNNPSYGLPVYTVYRECLIIGHTVYSVSRAREE